MRVVPKKAKILKKTVKKIAVKVDEGKDIKGKGKVILKCAGLHSDIFVHI